MTDRFFWVLAPLTLCALMLASLTIGRFPVPLSDVLMILSKAIASFSLDTGNAEESVIGIVRGPRILIAALVGGALGVAGAALQGIFRNPLVGPDIVGLSPGAAFGGALAILLIGNPLATIIGAFAGGLAAIIVVSAVARAGGASSVLALVLAGVVVGAFFGALVALITYLADVNSELPAILYWQLGTFAGADYQRLLLAAAVMIPATVAIFGLRYRINALALGDSEASGLGLSVVPLRWAVLTAITVIVAASVAVAGIIGWIGLVVPHIARLFVGPDHRLLLPASALIGAALLLIVDTMARSLTAAEIPLSVLTALVGVPVFVAVLRHRGRLGWGHG